MKRIFLFLFGLAWASAGVRGDVPVVRTMNEWWAIAGSPDKRTQAVQVDIEADVLFFDPVWKNLWLGVDGKPGYFPYRGEPVLMKPGTRIRLRGTTTPAIGLDGSSMVVEQLSETLETQPRMVERLGALDKFPNYDTYVVLKAFVEAAQIKDQNHSELIVVSGNHQIQTMVVGIPTQALTDYLGSHVIMRGILGVYRDNTGQPISVALSVTQWSDIVIDAEANLARKTAPDYVTLNPAERKVGMRVNLNGVVEGHDSSGILIVRSASEAVRVLAPRSKAVPERTSLALSGIVAGTSSGVALEDVSLTVVGLSQAAPVASQVSRPSHQFLFVRHLLDGSAANQTNAEVRLIGTVLAQDIPNRRFYFHDRTGVVAMQWDKSQELLPQPGTTVQIVGHVHYGKGLLTVRRDEVAQLGSGMLPGDNNATLEKVRAGDDVPQWVTLTGVVNGIEVAEGQARLRVGAPTGEFTVVVPSQTSLPEVRSIISAAGVSRLERSPGDPRARVVLFSPPERLQILKTARLIVEETEAAISPSSFKKEVASYPAHRLVSVRGKITYIGTDRMLILSDGTRPLRVFTIEQEKFAVADEVEFTGLPGRLGSEAVLRHAVGRKLQAGDPEVPVSLEWIELSDPSLHNHLISIDGRLEGVRSTAAGALLSLKLHLGYLEARLPVGFDAGPLFDLEPGSRLRVVGLAQVQEADERGAAGMHLMLRDARDVLFLEPPEWFTATRLGKLLAFSGVGILVAGTWVWLLRRRVGQQTRLIREQMVQANLLAATQKGILDNVQDFIFTLDLDGRFTSFNCAGETLTGFSVEESGHLTIYDLLDDWAKKRVRIVLERLSKRFAFKVFESEIIRRDGTRIWVEVNAGFIRTPDGLTAGLGVMRDVTVRKKLEAEMKLARETAEANTRAKSAFLATMSHELRTPMNGVIGMSDLLLQTPLDDEQADYARTIRSSAFSLVSLLNDLLDFSRIEAGSFRIDRVAFDLQELVDKSLTIIAPLATSKHLEIGIVVRDGVPNHLIGDPGRFRQILINLVSNGLKFTEAGGVQVTISSKPISETRISLQVEVADTGIGIPEEQKHKLFQPFSQVDADHSRKHGGAGLGLAICRHILSHMEGGIEFVSQVGVGTTFTFHAAFDINVAAQEPELLPPPVRIHVLGASTYTRNFMEHYALRFCTPVAFHATVIEVSAAIAHDMPLTTPPLILIDDADICDSAVVKAQMLRARLGDSGAIIAWLGWLDARPERKLLRDLGINHVASKPLTVTDLNGLLQRIRNRAGSTQTPFILRDTRSPAPPARASTLSGPVPERPRRRILIAEDNLVNQRIVKLQVERLGYETELVSNGAQVVPALERSHFDLVLMDCQMPELDGLEATRLIRSHAQFSTLPIIALTANALAEDRDRCIAVGMNGFVTKPLKVEELIKALDAAWGPDSSRQKS